VENPNYSEIRDVIAAAGFVVGVENKKYCREKSNELQFMGRIRVHFRNEDGSLINSKFPSRQLRNNMRSFKNYLQINHYCNIYR
jgi:signal recognition particle subunit SRP19